MRRVISIFLALLFIAPLQMRAVIVVNAASGTQADIQAAIITERLADPSNLQQGIVNIPPFNGGWTNTIYFTNCVILNFSGTNSCCITDYCAATPSSAQQLQSLIFIQTSEAATGEWGVNGIGFLQGTSRSAGGNPLIDGTIQVNGSGLATRICNSSWGTNGGIYNDNTGVFFFGRACGVIDSCYANMDGNPHFLSVQHTSWGGGTFNYGDGSYAIPVKYGSSNAVYVEDCCITNGTKSTSFAALDSFNGAHVVWRYNSNYYANVTGHGTESSGPNRSTRQDEIYNVLAVGNNGAQFFENRGGTSYLLNCTVTGYNSLVQYTAYRCTDNAYPAWTGTGTGLGNSGCTGTNLVDENNPSGLIATVTHVGANASTTLTVSGSPWSINQWRGYTAIDASGATAGSYAFSICNGNTSNTASFTIAETENPVKFNTGDTVKWYQALVCLDMPGMGTMNTGVTLRQAGTGYAIGPWPTQQIDPCYVDNCTLNDGAPVISAYPIILPNVHYYLAAPPGYTPFTYPHPLRGIAVAPPPSFNLVAVTSGTAVSFVAGTNAAPAAIIAQ